MAVNQIIEGTWKNIFNLDKELYDKRMEICTKCKLFKSIPVIGEICNGELYLNPITNTISDEEKPGHYQGCGCVLGSKTRVRDAHCPAKKW